MNSPTIPKIRVLFVCLGNICRSPTAEAVFRKKAKEAGLDIEIDSAGTNGFHTGETPDTRTREIGQKRGYDFSGIKSRQISEDDFAHFDHILGMDMKNIRALHDIAPLRQKSKLRLFLDYAPNTPTREVPDPYYSGKDGFENVLDLCEQACEGLISALKTNLAQIESPQQNGQDMKFISEQSDLDAFCRGASEKTYLCVDTEFMRESTFYSQLCLIQASTDDDEVIIDPLAKGLDLTPFYALMSDPSIIKVMHAARQDMEIFFQKTGKIPAPLFDTQIAAMALGFGDSVGYSALVKGRLERNLDKGARFTDWSRRPLSDKQLSYAMGDVTHLRDLYPGMAEELKERGRLAWVEEEMQHLTNPEIYMNNPDQAWQRLKLRSSKRHYLSALKAVAAWRERRAIEKNVPRRRVLKDDAVQAIAMQRPKDVSGLAKTRGVPNGLERSDSIKTLLADVKYAMDNIDTYAPDAPKHKHMPPNLGPTIEMLRTLLRLRTEYQQIAPRMVASAKEIEQIAAFGDAADVPALKGWRRDVFGEDALALLRGDIILRLDGREVIAENRT